MAIFAHSVDEIDLQPQLRDPNADANLISETQLILRANLQVHFDSAVKQIRNPEIREVAQSILEQVVRLLDWLSLIESNFQKLDTLKENLSLLELVHVESRALVEFIETKAAVTAAGDEVVRDVLDGVGYTISHDLRRVFEGELMGPIHGVAIPVVYGKIVHAHGLLTNCLQQTTITLAQLFDPTLSSSTLFDDSDERLKQSLLLCRDLSSLIALVRRVRDLSDRLVATHLISQIVDFRDGNMQFLMYRDWKGYEKLAHEIIMSIEHEGDTMPLLHQFLCYLETLFGHVRMRAVLTNVALPIADSLSRDYQRIGYYGEEDSEMAYASGRGYESHDYYGRGSSEFMDDPEREVFEIGDDDYESVERVELVERREPVEFCESGEPRDIAMESILEARRGDYHAADDDTASDYTAGGDTATRQTESAKNEALQRPFEPLEWKSGHF